MTRYIILAAAAVLPLGAAIPAAQAYELPMGWGCAETKFGTRCVNKDLQPRQSKAVHDYMMKTLKDFGYPSAITVNSPEAYEKVTRGWRKTGDCYVEPIQNVSHDKRVEKAKTVFCLMSQKGYDVPKPRIVKAY